jgi:hypothetical protein
MSAGTSLTYDELDEGQSCEVERTVSAADIDAFAAVIARGCEAALRRCVSGRCRTLGAGLIVG